MSCRISRVASKALSRAGNFEHRRLHSLLKAATQAALNVKDEVRPNEQVGFELMQSSSRIRSVSQWALYDPAERVTDSSMQAAEPSELDLETVSELVRQSEIDFRTLKAHVRAILGSSLRFPSRTGPC